MEFDGRLGATGIPIDLTECGVAPGRQREIAGSQPQDAICTGNGFVVAAGELKQFRDQGVAGGLLIWRSTRPREERSESLPIATGINERGDLLH
jgi:hypothetical protein